MQKRKDDGWQRIFILLVLGGMLLAFFLLRTGQTGKVILELKPEVEGKNLTGLLRMHMKEGELIPASTKVIATLEGQKKEYRLYDLVKDEKKRGDFFVEETDVHGMGDGYGFPGKKTVYPKVTVHLIIEKEIVHEQAVIHDSDGDTYSPPGDCDDSAALIHPDATERCNGIDDNCANGIDEGCNCRDGATQPCGTNVGSCSFGEQTCENGAWGDCAGGVGPLVEKCDQEDNNCDGNVDEGDVCTPSGIDSSADGVGGGSAGGGSADGGSASGGSGESGFPPDNDGDSFFPSEDCDDSSALIHPGATETCNQEDDDCDGSIDENDVCAPAGASSSPPDTDGDGFSPPEDCDDADRTVHPQAVEDCNGIDDNCDDNIDEDLGTKTCGVGACEITVDRCSGGLSQGCTPPPSENEECNEIDDDCDGLIDEHNICDPLPVDNDGDGFSPPEDCDDSAALIHPDAPERCNQEDDDCDGVIDEDDVCTSLGDNNLPPPLDNDGDGFSPPEDCNDNDGDVYSEAIERCNGIDDNCDDSIDEGCSCKDGSTQPCGTDVGSCSFGEQTCENGAWGDCVGDTGPISEICDQEDNDCDESIDEDDVCAPAGDDEFPPPPDEQPAPPETLSSPSPSLSPSPSPTYSPSSYSVTGSVIRFFDSLKKVTGYITGYITGNSIRDYTPSPLTGRAVTIDERSVQAVVSASFNYTTELKEGETVRVVSASTASGEIALDKITIEQIGNTVIISTMYSEEELGFGQEYLLDQLHPFDIILSELNLRPVNGILKVVLVYRGEEILDIARDIEVEEERDDQCTLEGFRCRSSCLSPEKRKNFSCATGVCCGEEELLTCSELQGDICDDIEVCSAHEIDASDGACCLGQCEEIEGDESDDGDRGEGFGELCEEEGFLCQSSCLFSQERKNKSCAVGVCCGLKSEVQTCDELGGELCDSYSACTEKESDAEEGGCCLAECRNIEDQEDGDEQQQGDDALDAGKEGDDESTEESNDEALEEEVQQSDIPGVRIDAVTSRNFVLGAVARFIILIDNRRSTPLKDVYVNLVLNDEEQTTFRSPQKEILPNSKSEIIAYGDTSSLHEGTYSGKIIFVYQGESFEKEIRATISKDEAVVMLEGRSSKKYLFFIFFTIIAFAVALGFFLIKFLKRRGLDLLTFSVFKSKQLKEGRRSR